MNKAILDKNYSMTGVIHAIVWPTLALISSIILVSIGLLERRGPAVRKTDVQPRFVLHLTPQRKLSTLCVHSLVQLETLKASPRNDLDPHVCVGNVNMCGIFR